jgi:signal transduction histidine kinase
VIRANAEILQSGGKDDPAFAGRLIDGLHRNAERLARIIGDLLDLSRLDAGQYRLELASGRRLDGAVAQAVHNTAIEANGHAPAAPRWSPSRCPPRSWRSPTPRRSIRCWST